MPSVSKKQRNFMAAAAHDPAFAKRVGISQKVATEFNQADKGKKFRGGGMAKCKKYEEGGLTFADMEKDDRDAAAAAAIADLDARQAARAANEKVSGVDLWTPEEKKAPKKAAPKVEKAPSKYSFSRATGAGERKRSAVGDLVDIFSRGGKYLMKSGGAVKAPSKSSSSSGSKVRGCGCAVKGKTRGRMV